MKIHGQAIRENQYLTTGVAKIPRPGGPLEVKVQAFPLGYDAEEILPAPRPPKTRARKKGGEVLRDGNGMPLFEYDENDRKYRKDRDENFWLQVVCNVYHAVRPCGEIEFDADREGGPDRDGEPREFFRAVRDELKAAGLTFGDLSLIVKEARRISNLGDLEESADAFFSETPPSEAVSSGGSESAAGASGISSSRPASDSP